MEENKKNLLGYYYNDGDVISRAIDYMDYEWYKTFSLDSTKKIRMFDSVYETAYSIFYSCISQGYEDKDLDVIQNVFEVNRLLERYVDIIIKILLYEFGKPEDFEQDAILATEREMNIKTKEILKEIVQPCLANDIPLFTNVK